MNPATGRAEQAGDSGKAGKADWPLGPGPPRWADEPVGACEL